MMTAVTVEVSPEVDPLVGRVFASRYRIEARLGEGAMGAVYRARHVKVGRAFAVKILHASLLTDPKIARRFEREAELAGKLHHINVVGVVDVGETEDGIHFMVMEYAEGPSLGSLLDGPMPTERVIHLVRQLLDGLEHAHERGLIHRDFKPDNVIVERDQDGAERPRIVDFGIALLRDEASAPDRADRLTTSGLVLGTPHYMAPEQAMGSAIDPRIDLFALGVTVYELLTGTLPFDGDGVDVARANLLTPTPPMRTRAPHVTVDPLLEAFTRVLMEKRPDDRFGSAKDARAVLDAIVADPPVAAAILGVHLDGTPDGSRPARPATPSPLRAGTPLPFPAVDPGSAPTAFPRPVTDVTSGPARRARTAPPRAVSEPGFEAMSSRAPSAPPVRAPTSPPARAQTSPPVRAQTARPDAHPVRWSIVAGVALVVVVVVIVVLTRGSSDSATSPSPSPSSSSSPPSSSSSPPSSPSPSTDTAAGTATGTATGTETATVTATEPATTDRPPPTETADRPPSTDTADRPPTTATGTSATRPRPRPTTTTRPTPTTTPPPAQQAATDTSASGVARLYALVGRELKALDTTHGKGTTAALWPRYTRIRINEAMATSDRRIETHATLTALRREITRAAQGPRPR